MSQTLHGPMGGPVVACGTARRIRALVAIGYGLDELAEHLGMDRARLWEWARDLRQAATPAEAGAVAGLYDRLSMQPVKSGRGAEFARSIAREMGWPSPLHWDDDPGPHFIDDPASTPWVGEVYVHPRQVGQIPNARLDHAVVERVIAGEWVATSRAERVEVIRALAERGYCAREIADRLRITRRSVERLRAQYGIPAALPHGRAE